ncbi:MAG: hypothetical protein LBL52_01810 [Rickettsiales bacterium]|jgi:SAM-dependent methyltransferase|nr:hypothetical protein [Rickettsiales bacterium]
MSEIKDIVLILANIALTLVAVHYFILFAFMSFRSGSAVPLPSTRIACNRLEPLLIKRFSGRKFTFLDLGCGSGRIVLFVAQRFPLARSIGIEHNPYIRLLFNIKRRILGLKNASAISADIFKADIGAVRPDAVYLYLSRAANAKITGKLKRELPSKTLIISNKFKLAGMRLVNTDKFVNFASGPLYIYSNERA